MRLTRRAHAVGLAGLGLLAGTALKPARGPTPFRRAPSTWRRPARASPPTTRRTRSCINPANLAWLPAWDSPVDVGELPGRRHQGRLRGWTGPRPPPCPSGWRPGCGSTSSSRRGAARPAKGLASRTAAATTRGSPGRSASSCGTGRPSGCRSQHSYSQNAYVDGLWGVTAALSYRPDPHVGFSAVARDFNEPSPTLVPSLLAPPAGAAGARRALHAGDGPASGGQAERRPRVRDAVLPGHERLGPAGTARRRRAYVGRAYASVEIAHLLNDSERGVLGTAGLELHFGGLSAGGGSALRQRLRAHSAGEYADGRDRRLHAAGAALPRPRRLNPPREHAGDARARGPPAEALAARRGARRRRRHPRPARRARELVRARRGDRRRDPRAPRARQEGPLLVGRRRRRRPSTPAPAPTASSSTRRGAPLRGPQVGVHLPEGTARQDRRARRFRPRRDRTRARPSSSPTSTPGPSPPRTTTTCCASKRRCSSATSRSTAT